MDRDYVRDEVEAEEGGTNLSDILLFIWDARYWMLLPALVAIVASAILYLAAGLTNPSTTTYQTAATLTMLSPEPGRYPNGSPFTLNDLRSPAVLFEVHRRNDLERYGMTLGDFTNAVGVSPYSPLREQIAERYRARLSNRQLTAEERAAIEPEFRAALEAASREGMLVSFTVPDNFAIPRDVARKTAADIPVVWSEIFVEVLGVGGVDVPRSGAELVSRDLLASLDYPLAYDYLVDSLSTLKKQLVDIAKVSGVGNARTSESQVTIFDIQRETENIESIYFNKVLRPIVDKGLSREPELTALSYENLIDQIRIDQRLARARAETISGIIAEGAAADRVVSGEAPASGGSGTISGGTSIPQFGDSFIDRIIGLSLSGSGLEYRQQLLDKKLELEEEVAILDRNLQVAQARLTAIRAFADSPSSSLVPQFNRAVETVLERMNGLWASSTDLVATLGGRTLNAQGRLFTPIGADRAVIRDSFANSRFLALAALALVAGMTVAGFVAYGFMRVLRHRRELRLRQAADGWN